jgi:hypothetical protein
MMAQVDESNIMTATPNETSETIETPASSPAERRLPFILRVSVVWTGKDDLPSAEDGQLRYWKQAPLTGQVVTTSGGNDVGFSDLEVQ